MYAFEGLKNKFLGKDADIRVHFYLFNYPKRCSEMAFF